MGVLYLHTCTYIHGAYIQTYFSQYIHTYIHTYVAQSIVSGILGPRRRAANEALRCIKKGGAGVQAGRRAGVRAARAERGQWQWALSPARCLDRP